MNVMNAILFSILAMIDLALIVRLRRMRSTRVREQRMLRSLDLAIQRENGLIQAPKVWYLRRAS